MKALQLVAPGKLAVTDTAVPEIGPAEVLLKVAAAGPCHSDIHVRHMPESIFPLPLTLGHETAGYVVRTGAEVSGWCEGDAALVHLIWACGVCAACARGDDNVCHAAGRGAMPPTPGLGPAGGMAEYMAAPARYLVPLGELDPVTAAPLADAGMTPYHVIRNSLSALRPGSTAVVVGIGGLGHLAVQILRQLSATRVIAVDLGEDRLTTARRHGAHEGLRADDGTAAAILELTSGRGADAVFDFVGVQPTVDLAADVVAPDGIYQLVGIGGGHVPIAAHPRFGTGWPWGATARTSYGGAKADLQDCVALASAGRLTVDVDTFALDGFRSTRARNHQRKGGTDPMTLRFAERTVLITGGARGMGASHVRAFVAEGARVVIADILDDEGHKLAAELGDWAYYVHLDVSDIAHWQTAVQTTESRFGPVHVLVNNAGIGGTPATVVDTDLDEWHRVLGINLDGTFFGIKTAVPSIIRAGGGAIVNVSSFAGLMGSPLLGGYAASKFAVRGLTKVAAMELGPLGIRVNSIHPGYIRTPLLEGIPDEAIRGRLAIERIASPDDVTPVVLFAASDDARYCTGAEFAVDGGWSAGEPSPIFVAPGAPLPEAADL